MSNINKAAVLNPFTDLTVNADTATKLQTPRTIGGVSFDGTANINLPGVNTTGNQSTSGNAGSATKLATARTLTVGRTGKAFDGSANIEWTATEVLPSATSGQFLKFDGTAWVAAADSNTTYSAMSQAEAATGTATSSRVITAAVLKSAIQTHAPVQTTVTGNAATATKLQTARTISLTGNVTGSASFDGSANASITTAITGLGAANGIATLDSNGKVPSTQLPSYVDDVLEYVNVAAFPTTGETGKIYVETTGNTTYRWGGTAYVKLPSGEVSSVAGKTGVVTLTKADVGLDQVDNTSDAQKPISTATQLALNGKVNKSDVIDTTKGGTGATTAAGARANIGALGVGDQGLGGDAVLYTGGGSRAGFETFHKKRSGFFFNNTSGISLNGGVLPQYSAYLVSVLDGGGFFAVGGSTTGNELFAIRGGINSAYPVTKYSLLHSGIYTVDGNGFIKSASPVVNLFSDKIELNNEAKEQPITFEKLGVGNYLIKGSTGLALEGWYIEQPKDANGNVFHAVIYETLDNGDLSIKTYAKKLNAVGAVEADLTQPVDIKESRFISIRLNELPKDTIAPINPTIPDNEGNAAPTKYHTLEEGLWIISEEDAAKLEQERLAAMQPLKRRQFRLTLAMNGYDLAEIESLINQIEDPMQRTIAQIEWQDATDFERTNPTLLMMAELMQLTSEQIDQLWSYGLAL